MLLFMTHTKAVDQQPKECQLKIRLCKKHRSSSQLGYCIASSVLML